MRSRGAAWRPRAAGHGDDAGHAEHPGQAQRVAQHGVMGTGDSSVGMERIPAAVKGTDGPTALLELAQPRSTRPTISQQELQVTVRGWRIIAGADLQVANAESLRLLQDVLQRRPRQAICKHADAHQSFLRDWSRVALVA